MEAATAFSAIRGRNGNDLRLHVLKALSSSPARSPGLPGQRCGLLPLSLPLRYQLPAFRFFLAASRISCASLSMDFILSSYSAFSASASSRLVFAVSDHPRSVFFFFQYFTRRIKEEIRHYKEQDKNIDSRDHNVVDPLRGQNLLTVQRSHLASFTNFRA